MPDLARSISKRPALRAVPPAAEPLTVANLEQTLVFLAYLVANGQVKYAPLLETIEAELEKALAIEAPRDRAQRILRRYTIDGSRKAIA